MPKTRELVEPSPKALDFNVEDIKKLICPEATNNELALFLKVCSAYQLNPFKNEIYLVKYKTQPAYITVGYATYLKRAEKHKKYQGFKCWTVKNQDGELIKACCEVRRKDWQEPLYWEVSAKEYVRMHFDKETRKMKPMALWATHPESQLKKVVISQAFKLAFPVQCELPPVKEAMKMLNAGEQLPQIEEKPPDTEVIDTLNQEQLQQLIIKQNENDITDVEFKDWLKNEYGIDTRKDIKNQWLPEVTQWIEFHKKPVEVHPEIPKETPKPLSQSEKEYSDTYLENVKELCSDMIDEMHKEKIFSLEGKTNMKFKLNSLKTVQEIDAFTKTLDDQRRKFQKEKGMFKEEK